MAVDEIQDIIRERGSNLNQADLDRINILAADIPLEDSDSVGALFEAVALIVNDPLYEGDIPPID